MATPRRTPLAPLAALLLALTAAGARAEDSPALLPLVVENADLVEQVVAVQSINLLNGLKLTPEQRGWLRTALLEVMASVDELRLVAGERRDEAAGLLGRLRDDVTAGRAPEKALGERVHALALEVAPLATAHQALLQRLAQEALDRLGPGQRVVVRRYHPCLVPAPLTDDVSFVGAAGSDDELLAGLDKVRAVPGALWFFVRGAVVRDVADKVTALAADLDRDAVAGTAGEAFDRARALSDVDWQLQRGEVARDLARKLGPLRFADGGGVPDQAKVVKFLLNPALLDMLEPEAHEGD